MTPPAWDGTCGPQEAQQRQLGRILARVAVFGSLFLLSAGIVAGVYLIVRIFRTH